MRNDLVYFKTGRSHVGIVETVSGTKLHTIEGNSSNMVKRRVYDLTEPTLTGYGIVSDYIKSSSGSSNEKKKNQSAKKELKALKEYLNKTKKESKTSEKVECFEIKSVNPHNKVNIDLMVYHKKKYYALPEKDGMSVTWQRKNTPGKLTFTTYTNKYPVVIWSR